MPEQTASPARNRYPRIETRDLDLAETGRALLRIAKLVDDEPARHQPEPEGGTGARLVEGGPEVGPSTGAL